MIPDLEPAELSRVQTELAPFHTLVKLIERELELAGAGEIDALQAAVERTGDHIRTLPVPPPESARALIERARALRARVSIETQRLRDAIALTMADRKRRRRITRSYKSPAQSGYSASV